jgi:hypothetical protein
MIRRNGISYNIYTINKPRHMEQTISTYIKQRDKYVNEAKELSKMYLDIFIVNKKIEY